MTSVMVFEGEYDLRCKEQLRRELARLTHDRNVILDFTGVRYLDSTCLSELIRANRLRRDKGFPSETVVLGSSETIRKLFGITRLNELFRVANSMEQALEQAGGEASFQHCFTADESF